VLFTAVAAGIMAGLLMDIISIVTGTRIDTMIITATGMTLIATNDRRRLKLPQELHQIGIKGLGLLDIGKMKAGGKHDQP